MNEDERIDLRALEPVDWPGTVQGTLRRLERVLATRERDPLTLIASWSRSLTIGAIMVVAVLIPVEVALEVREAETERIQTLVRFSTRTALGEEPPTGEELLRALGHDLVP